MKKAGIWRQAEDHVDEEDEVSEELLQAMVRWAVDCSSGKARLH